MRRSRQAGHVLEDAVWFPLHELERPISGSQHRLPYSLPLYRDLRVVQIHGSLRTHISLLVPVEEYWLGDRGLPLLPFDNPSTGCIYLGIFGFAAWPLPFPRHLHQWLACPFGMLEMGSAQALSCPGTQMLGGQNRPL